MSSISHSTTPHLHTPTINRPYLALLITLSAATFASVFIKLSQETGMPSLVVAVGRMGLAALFLSPLVIKSHLAELKRLNWRDIIFALFAGMWLCTHFVTMIVGMEQISILMTIVILNTSPIWVAILETVFLKARPTKLVWFGMIVALIGGIVIALAGNSASTDTSKNIWLGSGLMLLASAAGSVYLVIARGVRSKISVIPYVWMVFGFGGLVGLVVMAVTQTPLTGYPDMSYFWLLMLTLIPQLIGHSGYNYILGHFSATIVSVVNQILTVTATIAAFLIFHEVPTYLEIIGSIVVVVGVVLTILSPHLLRERQAEIGG